MPRRPHPRDHMRPGWERPTLRIGTAGGAWYASVAYPPAVVHVGSGATKEEALAQLKVKFFAAYKRWKAQGKPRALPCSTDHIICATLWVEWDELLAEAKTSS